MVICFYVFSFMVLLLVSPAKGQTQGTLRLVNGAHTKEGRVEVYINGTWGTVCDHGWDTNDTRVVCRQLFGDSSLSSPVKAYGRAFFGPGTVSQIWMDDVACSGSESRLIDCSANPFGSHNCNHGEDAGVSCDTTQDFDACFSSPCQNGATCISHTTPFTCACASGFIDQKCELSRDPEEVKLRLVDGAVFTEGTVQILINGTWGVVCDDSWGPTDARVVCRQLGYDTETVRAFTNTYFGRDSIPRSRFWLDEVACYGNESALIDCRSNEVGVHDCGAGEYAGVSCGMRQGYRMRLVNGSHGREGRVEVFASGTWKTICDSQWDYQDARVVCRQLGYDTAKAHALRGGYFGQGKGNGSDMLWNNVRCSGHEDALRQCSASSDTTGCDLSNDAGVLCDTSDEPGTFENCTVQLSPQNWSLVMSCDVIRLFSLSGRFEFVSKQLYQWQNTALNRQDGPVAFGPLERYYNLTDNKQYYRGRIVYSWPLFSSFPVYLGVEVSVLPSNTTKTIAKRIRVSPPARPTHNCSSLHYISESAVTPCSCFAENLGSPEGRLVWLLGNHTMATGDFGVQALRFPFDNVTNEHDGMVAVCRLDWIEPLDVFVAVFAVAETSPVDGKEALIWAAVGGGSVLGIVAIISTIVIIVMVVRCRRGHNMVCCWRSPMYDRPVVKQTVTDENQYEVLNTVHQTSRRVDENIYENEALSHM